MISALILALTLVSPPLPAPQLKRCANACYLDDRTYVCGYWEKYKCGRQEFECIDGPNVVCESNVVSLGEWDPVPTLVKPFTKPSSSY